jgi:hypothetical protein
VKIVIVVAAAILSLSLRPLPPTVLSGQLLKNIRRRNVANPIDDVGVVAAVVFI